MSWADKNANMVLNMRTGQVDGGDIKWADDVSTHSKHAADVRMILLAHYK